MQLIPKGEQASHELAGIGAFLLTGSGLLGISEGFFIDSELMIIVGMGYLGLSALIIGIIAQANNQLEDDN